MTYQHICMPKVGEKIFVKDGKLKVPKHPIIGFIEGDGIGPDITKSSLLVWDAAVEAAYSGDRKIHWCEIYLGEKAASLYDGNYFPNETLEVIKQIMVAIKGPLTTPIGGGFRSLNVALRQELDLYACVRPIRYYAGVPSPMRHPEKVDIVIFRENTEDVYAGIEYKSGTPENAKITKFLREEMGAKFFEDAGIGIKPISPFGSKRLVRKAIQYAIDHGRDSVTLVHKGNIMKFTEGAFRNWGYEVARTEFADQTITEDELYSVYGGKQPPSKVVIKDRIADIMFQLLQLRPEEFSVLATMNLNGDYLSDAVAAEVGGIGIAPGANIADHVAVFEATHGTAPKYANLDRVNPGSLLLSGVMLLQYIGWIEAAELIESALACVIADKTVTYDFARQMTGATEVSTSKFCELLITKMIGQTQILRKEIEHRRHNQEEYRRILEAARVADPVQAMIASGHMPTVVGNIMSPVITVKSNDLVNTAMHTMVEEGVDAVMVEPDDSLQWGIMTDRDVLKKIISANLSPARVRVGEVTTRPLVTAKPEMSLAEAAQRMSEANVRRVVVEADGNPIGMVTDNDLFRTVEVFGWGSEI